MAAVRSAIHLSPLFRFLEPPLDALTTLLACQFETFEARELVGWNGSFQIRSSMTVGDALVTELLIVQNSREGLLEAKELLLRRWKDRLGRQPINHL